MEALLVVDVQKALIKGAYREQDVLEAIRVASSAVRGRGGVVVFIQHCHSTFEPFMRGKPGWALHESLDVKEGDCFIEKEASDSFYETNLDSLLRERGVTTVWVAGLQTEYCVDATCRAALSHGYEVTLVSDAHTTGDDLFTAAQTIAHHNLILGNLAHPKTSILVKESNEL